MRGAREFLVFSSSWDNQHPCHSGPEVGNECQDVVLAWYFPNAIADERRRRQAALLDMLPSNDTFAAKRHPVRRSDDGHGCQGALRSPSASAPALAWEPGWPDVSSTAAHRNSAASRPARRRGVRVNRQIPRSVRGSECRIVRPGPRA